MNEAVLIDDEMIYTDDIVFNKARQLGHTLEIEDITDKLKELTPEEFKSLQLGAKAMERYLKSQMIDDYVRRGKLPEGFPVNRAMRRAAKRG